MSSQISLTSWMSYLEWGYPHCTWMLLRLVRVWKSMTTQSKIQLQGASKQFLNQLLFPAHSFNDFLIGWRKVCKKTKNMGSTISSTVFFEHLKTPKTLIPQFTNGSRTWLECSTITLKRESKLQRKCLPCLRVIF